MDEIDILLVEDNSNDAELTLRALKKTSLHNRVQWVKDGAEALDYVFCAGTYAQRDQTLPRLVLLDIKLPKIDGVEVLRRMKNHTLSKTVPVVMLTSSAEDRDIIESYKLGVNSYIVKPVEFNNFVETVAKVGLYWMITNKGLR
ncbi:MAG: response regulator [Gammaproteobacteria bacterium]|nr:response regulator [Gammaproteobacteria bacterium]